MPASYRREVEYDRNRVSRVNPPVDDDGDEAPEAPVVTFKKLRKADDGYGDRGTVVRTSARYGVYRDGVLLAVIVNGNHSMRYRDEGIWQILHPETLRLIPGTSAGASHLRIAKGVAEDVFGRGGRLEFWAPESEA